MNGPSVLETRVGPDADQVTAEEGGHPGQQRLTNIGIIIPTYNAALHWADLSSSLALEGVDASQVLIVDSSSKDATRELARRSGYRVICIPQQEFNHGATRQMACSYFPGIEQLLFCTQDVVFRGLRAIDILSETLNDPAVGAAYGRQIPRPEANAIERHARLFNYPATCQLRTFESRQKFGIKTVFFSNSFALYRRSALEAVGGFPPNVVLSEDAIVAARMLLAGWKIVYEANAMVIHSHPISLIDEASRYFDIGAHHARDAWMLEAFGSATSEGKLFVQSQIQYLLTHAPHLIPLALLRTANKLVAYRLGTLERHLPTGLKRRISSYPQFWTNNQGK